ncbi:glycosyltransferase [Acidicapsa ligni]|uniref:glycosyltransferase n=1 Tax=Acidicapsa ligni TaxID=542300 RepID=UPI0021E03202|nr:glycosyltransferase [Acidicapsa ligni]
MRIAYVLTTLGIGGAEKQVISLAERMAAKGHIVTLILLKHSSAEEWPVKLPVMRLNMQKTPRSILNGLRFAAQFLAIFRPDVLHSHTFPANIFSRLLRWRGVTAATVNTIHNIYEGGWHRMLLYRMTDRFADVVTAVSLAAKARFIRTHAVAAKKMFLVTNGIDTAAFVPERSSRDNMRKQRHVVDAFVWLAIGRLVPAKDYPNLLRAFTIVRLQHSNAVLWIAGEGDQAGIESGPETMHEVHFLGLRRDIPTLLDAADGFVLSSAWEGMPLVMGEAMAMQKPIVATDVGGVRELLGETGEVVAAKNSQALAGAMLNTMAQSNRERREMGTRARERVSSLFSMDAKAEEWQSLYERVIAQEKE